MKPNYAALIKELPAEAAKALQQLRIINSKALGGVSVADNLFAEFVELPFVHGEPIQRPSPLRGRSIPKGFEVIAAWDSNNNAIPFPTSEFDENFEDSGEWRLTFYAPAPSGVCSIYRSAADDTANSSAEVIPFDTEDIAMGDLAYDSTVTGIRCSRAGIIRAGYALGWAASAAGFRLSYIRKNASTTTIYGTQTSVGSATASPGFSGSALIAVAANDYLQLIGFQTSGAALAVDVSNNRARLDAHYVAPPIGYSGTVLGIMWGG